MATKIQDTITRQLMYISARAERLTKLGIMQNMSPRFQKNISAVAAYYSNQLDSCGISAVELQDEVDNVSVVLTVCGDVLRDYDTHANYCNINDLDSFSISRFLSVFKSLQQKVDLFNDACFSK